MNLSAASAALDVIVENRQQTNAVDVEHLKTLLCESLTELGITPPAEVGLAFIGAVEMEALNRVHMGGTGPTDVLSFPIDGTLGPPQGQPAMLGDIVVCPEVASRAPQPLDDELALLVVHGALHLLGHDHAEPDETVIMKELESGLLNRFHAVR